MSLDTKWTIAFIWIFGSALADFNYLFNRKESTWSDVEDVKGHRNIRKANFSLPRYILVVDNRKKCRNAQRSPNGECVYEIAQVLQESMVLPPFSDSFSCANVPFAGLYADPNFACQVYHICDMDGHQYTFQCPFGTALSQKYFICDYSVKVNCYESTWWYYLNQFFYDPNFRPIYPSRPNRFSLLDLFRDQHILQVPSFRPYRLVYAEDATKNPKPGPQTEPNTPPATASPATTPALGPETSAHKGLATTEADLGSQTTDNSTTPTLVSQTLPLEDPATSTASTPALVTQTSDTTTVGSVSTPAPVPQLNSHGAALRRPQRPLRRRRTSARPSSTSTPLPTTITQKLTENIWPSVATSSSASPDVPAPAMKTRNPETATPAVEIPDPKDENPEDYEEPVYGFEYSDI